MTNGTHPWRLDRRVSLGHLVTTAMVLVAMVLWGGRLETRLVLLEDAAPRQAAVDARQDAAALRLRQEIRDELRQLNAKLDRLWQKRWGERWGDRGAAGGGAGR
jgi:hypothetical protein